jgi:hypothetical protein
MAVRVPFRLRRLAWLISASLAATGTAAAAPAARVDFTIGGVTVTGADGRSRPATKGLELESGDRIVTAAGRAQLRFTDGAFVSLQPNTDFTIRDYHYDGKTDGTERGVFGLVRGALRTVTGAIGRVNRSAYRIQTPTATIGIRGTGGLIQILPDGSTLVTGNSGVWSVGNQKAAVDVPAGKAVKAGPDQSVPPMEVPDGPMLPPPQSRLLETPLWPTESDSLTGMPTGAPNTGPLFVPGPGTEFVAGDNVTPAGLPASLFGTLSCGTSAGCEFAYAFLDGSGNAPAQFHANAGQITLDASGAVTAFNDGTSTKAVSGMNVDTGSSGGVVSWGRWVGGATINGSPWPGFQTLAYVTGLPTPIADITSMTGSFTFNLVGWTKPTDSLGTVGTVTGGQLVGTFGPAPTFSINNFSFAVAGNAYTMSTPTPVGFSAAGPYAPFSASGPQLQTLGAACASGCNAQVSGHFMGAGATHAGFAYNVMPFGPAAPIAGAAAFQRPPP